MKVWVAVFNPQGSMGGFQWNESLVDICEFVIENPEIPYLGIVQAEVDSRTSAWDCTQQIDAQLTELEKRLGYDSREYDH